MKFRVTVTYEYDVTQEEAEKYYETTDPIEMAEIDEENMNRSTRVILDDIGAAPWYGVTVVPVSGGGVTTPDPGRLPKPDEQPPIRPLPPKPVKP